MSFVDELKRRKVIRVAFAYTVTAWLVAQIIDVINEPFNLPGWFDTFALTLLAIGLPIALVLAWAFDQGNSQTAGLVKINRMAGALLEVFEELDAVITEIESKSVDIQITSLARRLRSCPARDRAAVD